MSWRKAVANDARCLMELLAEGDSRYSDVGDFKMEEETATVKIANGSFTLLFSEEYPASTTIYSSDGACTKQGMLMDIVFSLQDGNETEEGETEDSDSNEDISLSEDEASYHPLIDRDVQLFRDKFGMRARVHALPSLERVAVSLDLDPSVLAPVTAEAWGVDRGTPITISVDLHGKMYTTEAAPPTVKLTQDGQDFRLAFQLRNMLEAFFSRHWSSLDGTYRPDEADGMSTRAKGKQEEPVSSLHGMHGVEDQHMALALDILQMGLVHMDLPIVVNAVRMTGTLDGAINLLLESPELAQVPLEEPPPKETKKKKKGSRARITKEQAERNMSTELGLFVVMGTYILERLPTLHRFCVICDETHTLGSGMLKPSICNRPLCAFGFQQLGLGVGYADGLALCSQVSSLLVAIALSAARSPRKELIFKPFPTVFDASNNRRLLDPDAPDFNLARQALESLSVRRAIETGQSGSHELADGIFNWLINSNRSHLVSLPREERVRTMGECHQFMLLSSTPEKEEAFQRQKRKKGSCFAFHGSPVENWHSILRNGLKNASGTKLQMHGAAHGAGIYLSPAPQVSFGYSRMGGGGGGGGQVTQNDDLVDISRFHGCIAVCEVIDTGIRRSGDVWVQPTEDFVVTRFLFAYQQGIQIPSLRTDDAKFVQEFRKAIDFVEKNYVFE